MDDFSVEPDEPGPMPRMVLRPTVEPPRPRLRLGFLVALLLATTAGLVTLLLRTAHHERATDDSAAWATALPARCTPLEVELALRDLSTDASRAACLAIAGQIDRARQIYLAMPEDQRADAVRPLFEAAHPIADLGDDRSAGPIMKLVVEMWPDNYMAVFHAGMAEFALGHDEEAARQLEHFLDMYAARDVWRDRAEHALSAIVAHAPIELRQAHFPE